MEDVVRPADGVRPPRVLHQIRFHEGQLRVAGDPRVAEHRADGVLLAERANGGPDDVPLIQQLSDDMTGDEAGPARDENLGHGRDLS
ncbi:hypothetical protein GCM10022202_36580 [Microbacterium marinilacus]|uniref:Uncharacterized protein n=1 Tax=Microbacterium marinilacus TaxID=415209 RepID=A0ABP7BYP3_9MICO